MGRPLGDRRLIARAFVAKAVYDLADTALLIEMLLRQPSCRESGHVPTIDSIARSVGKMPLDPAAARRYGEGTARSMRT